MEKFGNTDSEGTVSEDDSIARNGKIDLFGEKTMSTSITNWRPFVDFCSKYKKTQTTDLWI